jgi:phosphopantothenoylcysteine synthetase/decarboxylase
MKRIVILGGGTFNPIRNHLSIAAPAFGATTKQLHFMLAYMQIPSERVLTKMADHESNLKSNDDVSGFIDELLDDENVGTIVMNVAMCDFKCNHEGVKGDFHGERIKSREGNISLELEPADKVIAKIKQKRPDIFLVGFKTTTNATHNQQLDAADRMISDTNCDVVFANDTVTRYNMLITNKFIHASHDRDELLHDLTDILKDNVSERNNSGSTPSH